MSFRGAIRHFTFKGILLLDRSNAKPWNYQLLYDGNDEKLLCHFRHSGKGKYKRARHILKTLSKFLILLKGGVLETTFFQDLHTHKWIHKVRPRGAIIAKIS